jgi:hypothetical protein
MTGNALATVLRAIFPCFVTTGLDPAMVTKRRHRCLINLRAKRAARTGLFCFILSVPTPRKD